LILSLCTVCRCRLQEPSAIDWKQLADAMTSGASGASASGGSGGVASSGDGDGDARSDAGAIAQGTAGTGGDDADAGECRTLCFCDDDCGAAECCTEAVGELGFEAGGAC
jgi:hypothetical protein